MKDERLQKITNFDGELTDDAMAALAQSSSEREASRKEVEKKIKEQEKLMLKLMSKLEHEGRGDRSLYRTLGRGKDRIVISAIPNISDSNAPDRYRANYLVICRRGFFTVIGSGDSKMTKDEAEWFQNPFVLRQDTQNARLDMDSFYNGVIRGKNTRGWKFSVKLEHNIEEGVKIPARINIKRQWELSDKAHEKSTYFGIHPISDEEFLERFFEIEEIVRGAYNAALNRTSGQTNAVRTVLESDYGKRKRFWQR